MGARKLQWQSKLVLLLVVPWIATSVFFQAGDWIVNVHRVAVWTIGLSLMLGLLAWGLRSATITGAATGSLLIASLMFSTVHFPYRIVQSALVPVVTLLVLTSLATRFGRARKERLGTAEERRGRGAAQVAANLGFAAIVSHPSAHAWVVDALAVRFSPPLSFFAIGMAALAEAAADTVSSEIGQALGGTPVMITTLRPVAPGTDGGITVAGTVAGILAAGLISATGLFVFTGDLNMWGVSWAGGTFGLFFDSLLGATLERKGWLNNDAVNFTSTISAAAFALVLLALSPRP